VLGRAPLGAAVRGHGHTVRLMAPKFVTPYRMSGKRGKNDAADAAAICEALQRPHMRFVPIKTEEQQSRLMVHRARQGFVDRAHGHINRIRGLLSEFGIVLPLKADRGAPGRASTWRTCPATPTRSSATCSARSRTWTSASAQYDQHIHAMARQRRRASNSCGSCGMGETTATALVAMVGNAHDFDCGRQFAAWLGLVPGQYSSGGKARLGRITKAGDAYLRSLLVLGARAVLATRPRARPTAVSRWATGAGRAARLLASGGGHRGEERAHGLGGAAPR
jgi:transposase